MATKKPSRAIKRFGTEVPDTKGRLLRAGALTAILDSGALRYIRYNGKEVLRAVAFLVRDENWGTFTPEIRNLKIRQGRDYFEVGYEAHCADAKRGLVYRAEIASVVGGALRFQASAIPETDFLTNRTGFIVLHPLNGVAGCPVEIEHVDGSKVKSKFPAIIDPVQPFHEIRALKHQVAPGLHVTCRMEGDTFEMEDHRNWTDASFKTYVRPLARPWPYTLAKGVEIKQSVSLAFSGKMPRPRAAGAAKRVEVSLGRASGKMPALGVGVPADEAGPALAQAALIKAAGIRHFVCQVDSRRSDIDAALARYRRLGEATGADIVLEIVLPGRMAPAAELAPIADKVRRARLVPAAIAVSPAADLKAVLPGSKGPDVPALAEIYAAARQAFPGVPLGGGMFSYFTELNRKRPPVDLLDFVTHTSCPIVHAADDVSVMETLEALPYVIQSTKAFIKGKPYRVGPSSIPARDNPYGAATAANPGNARVCLANMDPRQRGLYGAAWTLGYIAAFAKGGIVALTMGAATGPAGMIHRRAEFAQPYFDDLGGPAVYPLYHVIAGLSRAAGARLLATEIGLPSAIAAIAYRAGSGPILWLANLTGARQGVKVSGFPGPAIQHAIDEASFSKAIADPDFLARGGTETRKVGAIDLGPYAIMRLAAGA